MIDTFKGLAADLGAEGGIGIWDIVVVAAVFLAALAFLVRLHGGGRKRQNASACSCCGGGCASQAPGHACGTDAGPALLPPHGPAAGRSR